MSEIEQRYRTVSDGFTARLDGLPDDAWASPTPCTDWTVRDLVAHVVGTQRFALAALEGDEPADVDADGDLVAQWTDARNAVLANLGDAGRASAMLKSGPFGEQPFESLVGGVICSDTLIHTWDLARATGQDERLDAGAVIASAAFLEPIDDKIRRPGAFSPKLDAPSGADEQTRLICFAGRPV
jgi:uncharacterized protein (TIGR03086 family)